MLFTHRTASIPHSCSSFRSHCVAALFSSSFSSHSLRLLCSLRYLVQLSGMLILLFLDEINNIPKSTLFFSTLIKPNHIRAYTHTHTHTRLRRTITLTLRFKYATFFGLLIVAVACTRPRGPCALNLKPRQTLYYSLMNISTWRPCCAFAGSVGDLR